ncbi:hypothetical protein PVAG01_09354 [Phlyctema vagabunda]|uniref:DUF6546 domain-containing protein n=1 Tax=Phlyctema vagabunda TaxID=108571 RepID=A0ABR4P743_9HELO
MGTLTIKSTYSQVFPKVEIVTHLLIRRQFYRKIGARSLSKLLRESFTCLRWFCHELWHHVNPQQQPSFEKDYNSLITRSLPSTLRELFIFEDFNKLLHPERSTKRANPSLGRALSKSSRFLENLSAAFLVDAEDFFANLRPSNQQSLNIGRAKINRLLIAAGRAAAFMPKLEIMEIWNGGEEHACIFRYRNGTKEPKITWKCNWSRRVRLDPNVVNCWADLPRHGGNLTAVVDRIRRPPKLVKTHSTAIRYLQTRRAIVDPISGCQLFLEECDQLKN